MKYRMLAVVVGFAFVASVSASDKYVAPHVKKDGTYVQGHFKTQRNDTKVDNYSSKPSVNPYTGVKGTKDPYKSKY